MDREDRRHDTGHRRGNRRGFLDVGVAMSGNALGLSSQDLNALSEPERAMRRADAVSELTLAGAHYVVDSVTDLPAVLDIIDGRLARGDTP